MSNLARILNPEQDAKIKSLENRSYLYEKFGNKVFIETKGDCRAAHEALMLQYANKIIRRN